ncbi:hypothetical protein [Sedimentisphaera salicampi]|uniref:Uncharacterized protein n=1 Tax=Sedimentisphaera salicampi TaxID=1941349 RepID=A0A1W6LIY8_9BACT|nr:hypothetical protein [Sedimentisphaera salicampi]ARN55758.1 hypothetical protein STSP1_00123 [Sedimentisphaera salicampi]
MWKIINSPIVITIIVIAAAFIFKASAQPKLASEIRAAYDEINAILEEGATEAEKTKAIQQFAEQVGSQLSEGFSSGFGGGNLEKKIEENKAFIKARNNLSISGIKYAESQFNRREKVIFKLKNNGKKALTRLKLNFEFYKDDKLIDCENVWINEVNLLEPGSEIALNQTRSLPKENQKEHKSDEVIIKVTSFDIEKIE